VFEVGQGWGNFRRGIRGWHRHLHTKTDIGTSFGLIYIVLCVRTLFNQRRIRQLEFYQRVKLFRRGQGSISVCAKTCCIAKISAVRAVAATSNSSFELTQNNAIKNTKHTVEPTDIYKTLTNI